MSDKFYCKVRLLFITKYEKYYQVRRLLQRSTEHTAAAQMTWTYVLNPVENVKKLYQASLLSHGLFN